MQADSQEQFVKKRRAAKVGQGSDATRARLVKTAADLFLRRGYGRVSVRELAAACGMTTGAIYARFRNKAEMLVAAIEERMESEMEFGSRHQSAKAIGRGATEPGILERFLLENIENSPSRAALRALLLEGAAAARRDRDVRAVLQEEQLDHLRWWSEIYRDWQRGQGIDSTIDAASIVQLLWAAELGFGILEAYGIDPPPPRDTRRLVDRLLQSLRR
jgi:AcrR family transcriptional regulator